MSVTGLPRAVVMPPLRSRSVPAPRRATPTVAEILDETPAPLRRDSGLPVGDQRVLGEEPGQRRP